MKLYQEIIFLEYYYKGKWIVENVIPFYEPIIPAKKRGSERKVKISAVNEEVERMSKFHDYDFKQYKGKQRLDKIARNLVDYEAGRTIFETALGIIRKQDTTQTELF